MKEPLDDFLKHIKKTLLSHEEPYQEGAWERFAQKHQPEEKPAKPVIPIWRWMAAAAAILTGLFFMIQYLTNSPKPLINPSQNIPIVSNKKTSEPVDHNKSAINTEEEITTSFPDDKNTLIAQHSEKDFQKPEISNATISPANVEKEMTTETIVPNSEPETIKPSNENQRKPEFWENKIVKADDANQEANRKNQSPVVRMTDPALTVSTGHQNKWQSSLYLSPTYSELGVSMGYGYSIGYAVNNRIKINSGIAYTQISASKNYDKPAASSSIVTFGTAQKGAINAASAGASASVIAASVEPVSPGTADGPKNQILEKNFGDISMAPSLNYLEGRISGIDIPFGINYSISKKFYTEAGISGLFILKRGHTANYVENENLRITVFDNDKVVENKVVPITNNFSTSNVADPEGTHQSNFMGFYNISMGYKQKISRTNAVSLEPFVKIPMQNSNAQKLNYLGMGVRLKFDF